MKSKFILSLCLFAGVLLVSCKEKSGGGDVVIVPGDLPGACTITGPDRNEKPETTVTLTASAEGAESYVWLDASGEIEGATGATYVVTESGNYYAAGVNSVGRGATSNAKQVTIHEHFEYTDLEGRYTASGVPQEWVTGVPNASSWTSEITYDPGDPDNQVGPFYFISNWVGMDWGIYIDIDNNNRLLIDSDTIVCSHTQQAFIAGHLIACYMNESRQLVPVHPYEVSWDGVNGVLDFSGQVNGHDVVIFVLATNMQTAQDVGGFTDGYKNLKLTRDPDSRAMTFSGEKVEISSEQIYGTFK